MLSATVVLVVVVVVEVVVVVVVEVVEVVLHACVVHARFDTDAGGGGGGNVAPGFKMQAAANGLDALLDG